jgi:hypothetical protein
VCRWHATYRWKALNKGYNFSSNFTSIKGLHTKLWMSKVVGILFFEISGFSLGSLETKWHLGARPMARHKVYYKGKVVTSPKSGPWWVLWVCVYPWFVRAPKCYNYTLTNLLFGLCRFVWVIELLVNLPNPPPEAPTPPFTPKVVRARECAQLLFLLLFLPLDS